MTKKITKVPQQSVEIVHMKGTNTYSIYVDNEWYADSDYFIGAFDLFERLVNRLIKNSSAPVIKLSNTHYACVNDLEPE